MFMLLIQKFYFLGEEEINFGDTDSCLIGLDGNFPDAPEQSVSAEELCVVQHKKKQDSRGIKHLGWRLLCFRSCPCPALDKSDR